jgi:acetyltransferase-like isoleucine patch superfamily enzyme
MTNLVELAHALGAGIRLPEKLGTVIRSKLVNGSRLARGQAFRVRHRIDGGTRLQLLGHVSVSRLAPHTRLVFGRDVFLRPDVAFYLEGQGATLSIGDRTSMNRRVHIACKGAVSIGRDCAISWDVVIMDTDFHEISGQRMSVSEVRIDDHVLIGARAMVLKGVHVGQGAVIGANSVVNTDVPSGALVAGNPAKIIRDQVDWR